MKKYNKFDIDRVKSAADIRDFIPGLSGRGATQYCECPECHKSGRNKGLCVTHKTNMDIAKCFSCGFTINGAIDAVQYYELNSSYKCNGIHINNLFKFFVWCEVSKSFTRSII